MAKTVPSVVDRIIIGVDPGTQATGYGLIHIQPTGVRLLAVGTLKLDKLLDHPQKLKCILDEMLLLIDTYKPDELAVEAPFYGDNPQSMLKLGRAQGVVMAAAMLRSIPIFEYAPRKVKMAVTGRGAASKAQVASMLHTLLPQLTAELKPTLDSTDALAVAMCHYFQGRVGSSTKAIQRKGGWGAFIAANPERLG